MCRNLLNPTKPGVALTRRDPEIFTPLNFVQQQTSESHCCRLKRQTWTGSAAAGPVNGERLVLGVRGKSHHSAHAALSSSRDHSQNQHRENPNTEEHGKAFLVYVSLVSTSRLFAEGE